MEIVKFNWISPKCCLV